MPARMQAAVASFENEILGVLSTYANDAQRNQIVHAAATNTDWLQPAATKTFVELISASATASCPGVLPTTRAAQLER